MNNKIIFEDLGLIDYKDAWDYQEKLFNQTLKIKLSGGITPNRLLFCEHRNVYTLGKNGSRDNLLVDEAFLKKKDAVFYKIDRGGDITYHGKGQIVGYPILDLENFNCGIKDYVWRLEEAIILTVAEYGISAERLPGATGVWLGVNRDSPRKICAIGLRASRSVTMHGFALNVNTDMEYFDYINPCGFTDKGVTSIQKELSIAIDFGEVKDLLRGNLQKCFNWAL